MKELIDQGAILEAIRNGTATDAEKVALFEKWEPLRRRIAYKFRTFLRCEDEIDDLLSESYFATIKAAETWKPEEGKSFAGWLSFYLHKTFERYIDEQSGNGLAAGASSKRSAIGRFERDHVLTYGRQPPEWLVCEKFEISPERLHKWRSMGFGARSLEEKIDENLTLLDTLEDPEDMESAVINRLLRAEVRALIEKYSKALTKDEREAIRFFYLDERPAEECAALMLVSVAHFHKIRRSALKRLRSSRLRYEAGRLFPEWLGSRPYRRGGRCGSSTEISALKLIEYEEDRKKYDKKSEA